jgi:hypothetical protein
MKVLKSKATTKPSKVKYSSCTLYFLKLKFLAVLMYISSENNELRAHFTL